MDHFLVGVLQESAAGAVTPPVPASGFATGPDYTVNYVPKVTATSSITQVGNAVRLSAGPTLANGDAEHCQILSKLRHPNRFIATVDITVRDNIVGSTTQEAGLWYFTMTGDESPDHPADITLWPNTDGSTRFEMFCEGYRASYDPLDPGGVNQDQIRLRQANANGSTNLAQIIGTGAPNTQPGSYPFLQNKTYRCTLRKDVNFFGFKYQNITDNGPVVDQINVTNELIGQYSVGQFIFRAMAGRIIDIEVVSVMEITDPVPPDPPDPPPIDTGELPPEQPGKVASIKTADQLQAALDDTSKLDGWTFYVDPAKGTNFGQTFNINKQVPVNKQRCVFRCENPGDIILSGTLNFGLNSSGVLFWGFSRKGANNHTNLRGKKNGIRRMDISGWQAGAPNGANTTIEPGEDCDIWYCSYHDPSDWTAQEIADSNAGTKYPLRMAIRANNVSPTTYMNGLHIYATNYYNFPNKIDPANYNSCQDDTFEPAEDVDQAATGPQGSGTSPILYLNWLMEKYLVEASHLQGLDDLGNKAKNGATIDIKAAGMHFKKATILCFGRIDNRGNGPNVYEDLYLECAGMDLSGGGPGPAGTPGHTVRRVNMVTGQWGKPAIQVICGNGKPNTKQTGTGISVFYQQCRDAVIEDIWGGTVLVGKQFKAADTFLPDGTIVRRTQGTTVTAAAGKQTNTTITQGTPQGTPPVKLTRNECGFTAPFVEPEF